MFSPQKPQTTFSLDNDAEMSTPYLSQGEALCEVVRLEVTDLGTMGGMTFFATLRVVQAANPADTPGSLRKYKRNKLTMDQRSGKNVAEVRKFFGALLGVDPQSAEPVPGGTWDELLAEVTAGEGTALAGTRVVVHTEDAVSTVSGRAFKKSVFTPAPAA